MDAIKKPIFIVLLFYMLTLIVSLAYGFQYIFVDSGLEAYFKDWSLPWFVVLIGLGWYALQKANKEAAAPPAWLGITLSSLSLALTSFFYLAKISSSPVWIACAVLPAILAIWLGRKYPNFSIRFLALIGLAVNLYLVTTVPHTSGANMLEIIEAAADDFLAGTNPYHIYEGIAEGSFQYLPAVWLPYVPLVWLGLDPRLLNILLLLLVVWLFERYLGLDKDRRASVLGATLYPLLLSPPVSQMIVHGHVWPYWAFLVATLVLLGRERYFSAAVVFGLALATRQPSLWLVLPLTGYLAKRGGWPNTVRYASISLVIYLLVVLPFAIPNGEAFWQAIYLGVSKFTTSQPHLSAATWLNPLDLAGLLLPIQALTLFFAFYWLYRRGTDFANFLAVTGAAYLMVVFFNNYAVRYVYLPGMLLFAASLALRLTTSHASKESPSSPVK